MRHVAHKLVADYLLRPNCDPEEYRHLSVEFNEYVEWVDFAEEVLGGLDEIPLVVA